MPRLPPARKSHTRRETAFTMPDFTTHYYPENRFGGFTRADGTVAFYTRVRALLQPTFTLLDVGCGRGEYAEDPLPFRRDLRIFCGSVARVIGLDVDAGAKDNPYLDEFRLLTGATWPLEDASVDMIVSDYVIEHVADPKAFLTECQRVLKPGGYLCLRTTNRLGYVGLISSLLPNKLHARIVGRVQERREDCDVFPTVYRCNTIGTMRRMLAAQGFEHSVYGHESEPTYLHFSRLAYGLGRIYQRLAPQSFCNMLFAFARKPEGR